MFRYVGSPDAMVTTSSHNDEPGASYSCKVSVTRSSLAPRYMCKHPYPHRLPSEIRSDIQMCCDPDPSVAHLSMCFIPLYHIRWSELNPGARFICQKWGIQSTILRHCPTACRPKLQLSRTAHYATAHCFATHMLRVWRYPVDHGISRQVCPNVHLGSNELRGRLRCWTPRLLY